MGRGASSIHNGVGNTLDVLVAALCRVLLLLVRFTLPLPNHQMSQDVFDLVASLRLGTVTDEFGGCT